MAARRRGLGNAVEPGHLDGRRDAVPVDIQECLLEQRPRDLVLAPNGFHASDEELEVVDEPGLSGLERLHYADGRSAIQRQRDERAFLLPASVGPRVGSSRG